MYSEFVFGKRVFFVVLVRCTFCTAAIAAVLWLSAKNIYWLITVTFSNYESFICPNMQP